VDEIIEDIPAATSRYQARDDVGNSMDTLKVIENPGGGYLGVYHSAADHGFTVHVASSNDLLTWTHRAIVDEPASQPTIAALSDGGFLLATEAGGSGRPAWLRFRHYPGLAQLLAARPDRTFDAPHTQVPSGKLAEGTPNIYSATLEPDLDHSVIDVGFHYFRDGDVDRQARGTLRDFQKWATARQPHLDAAVEAWDARGNIGDRDHLRLQGGDVTLLEGQLRKGDWSSWRVFLYDWSTGKAHPLRVRTHGGSTAFGNPTITALRSPSGFPAMLVTLFVFSEGAAAGEAGELVYFREMPAQD